MACAPNIDISCKKIKTDNECQISLAGTFSSQIKVFYSIICKSKSMHTKRILSMGLSDISEEKVDLLNVYTSVIVISKMEHHCVSNVTWEKYKANFVINDH